MRQLDSAGQRLPSHGFRNKSAVGGDPVIARARLKTENASVSTTRPDNWFRFIAREHPALLVSMIYVVASAIGMFYSWSYLRRFGINVFHFAQIGDFLLVSFKEPFTWLIVMAASTLIALDTWLSRRCEQHGAPRWLGWYASARYRSMNYLAVVVVVLVMLDVLAAVKARNTLAGNGERVEVLLAASDAKTSVDLIGSTGQFLFLFDSTTGRVAVHPHQGVLAIEVQIPGGEPVGSRVPASP